MLHHAFNKLIIKYFNNYIVKISLSLSPSLSLSLSCYYFATSENKSGNYTSLQVGNHVTVEQSFNLQWEFYAFYATPTISMQA